MTQIRHTPSPEHRFWLYSPEGDGLTFWRTAKERDVYAARDIRTYLDDNVWFEEVQEIVAGVVTHVVQPVNVQRPVGTLDEDGYDEDGNYWEQPDDTKCDYALMPLPQGEVPCCFSQKPMTKHLSSAAQAVLESTARQVLADRRINMEHIAAAALRAAEDQISSNADPGHGEWSDGYYEGVQETCLKILAIAAELLAIAAELEGDQAKPPRRQVFPTPHQIAECGGPCEKGGPEACDCGLHERSASKSTHLEIGDE